jgi:hypothetical protein
MLDQQDGPKSRLYPVWGVAANVVVERDPAPNGAGHHFAPGANVYLVYVVKAPGPRRVKVVGQLEGSECFVAVVLNAERLENWRAELVYSPDVLEVFAREAGVEGPAGDCRPARYPLWDSSYESKAKAQAMVYSLNCKSYVRSA